MGTAIAWLHRQAPMQGRWKPFLAGTVLVLGGAVVAGGIALFLERTFRTWPRPVSLLAEALVLKSMFSVHGLARAGRQVRSALEAGDLDGARSLLSWHLVSRDTRALNESQVTAATIESLAENLSDSFVAPLFFYAIAGLPGAVVYRFVNTCDAMLGYHDAEREWLGKVSARLDDLANLIPARLTAVLIILCGVLLGRNPARAAAIWRRDHRLTTSPNAGHPMSAAAGVLGVELEKVGCYRLGSGQRLPSAPDIGRATQLLWESAVLSLVAASTLLFFVK
jgi:adenosylcobinamide-phosphate synthase